MRAGMTAGVLGVLAACSAGLAQDAPDAQSAGSPAGPAAQSQRAADAVPVSGAKTLREDRRLVITLLGGGEVSFSTDLDEGAGEFSVYRAGGGVEFGVPVGTRAQFSFLTFAEGSWYDFDNAAGLVPGTDDPVDDVYRVTLRPLVSYQISERWGVFGAGVFTFAGEAGVDAGDAFTGGAFAGVRYALSPTLSLSGGFGGVSRLEDDALYVPYIGVDWEIDEQTTLSTTGLEGLGVRLTRRFADHWRVYVQGSYESRDYRLDEDNALPSGVFRDDRVPVLVGLGWDPSPRVSVELAGGLTAWQELEFKTSTGTDVSEVEADPAALLRLVLRISF